MRTLTVVYKWDNGKEGSFTRPRFPEIEDMALDASNPQHVSLYWGWFRQVLVTWRADAKRLRVGNKSNAPLSEAETADRMSRELIPVYAEPTEGQDIVEKIAAKLNPAQIAELLAKLGITEYK